MEKGTRTPGLVHGGGTFKRQQVEFRRRIREFLFMQKSFSLSWRWPAVSSGPVAGTAVIRAIPVPSGNRDQDRLKAGHAGPGRRQDGSLSLRVCVPAVPAAPRS